MNYIKTMFGSSLPPVVCRRTRVLFTLFVFVYIWWRLTHIVLFFFFVLCTLCCQFLWIVLFLIAPSVFFNIYLQDQIWNKTKSYNNTGSVALINTWCTTKHIYAALFSVSYFNLGLV